MSVALIIDSDEQLDSGVAWCQELVRLGASSIDLLVLGTERTSLAEQARRRAVETLEQIPINVHQVPRDRQSVLDELVATGAETLLLVHHKADSEFLAELFEQSSIPTLWVSGQARLHEPAGELYAVFANDQATTAVSEQLLRAAPTAALYDGEPPDRNQFKAAIVDSVKEAGLGANDLILCGADDFGAGDWRYRAGRTLLDQELTATVVLMHSGLTLIESWASWIYRRAGEITPPMEREARREFAKDLEDGSQPNFEFLGLISASAMLAAFGLLQDSAAVIIGAMLIAPLMTPIIGAGLALTQGNRPLFQTAVKTILLGFIGALVSSVLFGWLVLVFQEPVITDEMRARCRPSPLDFCVGLIGGIAASYARTRTHLSSALAGAAIAAALVPPISTAGLQIAFGAWTINEPPMIPVIGPLLLVGINVLTIMIGSSLVLWARGLRIDPIGALQDRWALRTATLLLVLALLTLIWIVQPTR